MRFSLVLICIFFVNCNQKENNLMITPLEKSFENVLFFEKMIVGETIRIDLSQRGCFHGNTYELSITKLIEGYEVTYLQKTSKLTLDKFELVKKFEKELRKKHPSMCSTVDNYLITNTVTHETFKAVDESCDWNGFMNLIEQLGLE